ncbi:ABC transporter permease subunit [Halospeciosus flavus]|uniref:ABC transporter permease subunit n=1 Tax=Halospeciosus flavus TaxID=3032283 RepID=A0ABD5Z761_9EURY|nr:ABC transporter permease subunit [Halospeciosus flavus]
MTHLAVARKDFRDALRSRTLWALYLLFLLFAAGTTLVYVTFFGGTGMQTGGLVQFLRRPTALLVSITALLAGYKSIAGERETGSLALLLSLPHSRLDVVLGKTLGRTAVVGVPVAAGFVVPFVFGLVRIDGFSVATFVGFTLLTLLFALAYVAVAVGLSATTGSTGVAATLAFGFWFGFQFAWGALVTVAELAASGFSLAAALGSEPLWARLLKSVSPSAGYSRATNALVGGSPQSADVVVLQDWFGAVVLCLWVVVPLAVGYWTFEHADL